MLKSIVSYGISILYLSCFGLILVFMHPFFVIGHAIGHGDDVMHVLNVLLNRNLKYVAGMRLKLRFDQKLPRDRSIILVSNHQSMYDIPLSYEIFAPWKLKFIAKVELERWIPSISFVLRNLGSALIKREDARQSLGAIKEFGQRAERDKLSVLIFPEGTRARDGIMKPFLSAGLLALLKNMPSALIVPVVIDGSWELLRYRGFPTPYGTEVTYTVLDPLEPKDYELKKLPEIVEGLIRAELTRQRAEHSGTNTQQDAAQ